MTVAFDVNAFNTINRVVAQFTLGISGDEIIDRAGLLRAVPCMELVGPGASVFLDGVKDFSSITTDYTGYGAPATGMTPTTPTEVTLPVGENNDYTEIAFRETLHHVRAVAGAGRMTDAAMAYAYKLAGQLDELRQKKVHRQHKRLNDVLVAGGSALAAAIDAAGNGHTVLKAMFRTANVDTLVLREDGLDAFLENSDIRAAIGASNASQAVSLSAFEQYLNDHFGRFVPWADGIDLVVDSLKVKSDHSGDYRMGNAMIGLRTKQSGGARSGRSNPMQVSGQVRLPFGAVQTYHPTGDTLAENPADSTELTKVNPNLSTGQMALNFSLSHRVFRDDKRKMVMHFLDDAHGAKIVRAGGAYIRTGVVT